MLTPLSATASEYPIRPIEITVTFAPGDTPDILARALSEGLSKDVGQSVVVINKLGAGGAVGAGAVARANPDGYSLLFAPALVQSVAPVVQSGANYKREALQPICQTFETQMALVVRPESPYKTVADIVSAAKSPRIGAKSVDGLPLVSLRSNCLSCELTVLASAKIDCTSVRPRFCYEHRIV